MAVGLLLRVFMKHLALLLVLAALSCDISIAEKDKTPKHQDPYVTGSTNESPVVKEVRHQLVMLPYYGVFDDLGFTVSGGTVTLTGEVTRPTLKSDAENVLKRLEGVSNVVNNIEVLPLSPNDDQIRRAIYRTIYGDPSLSTRYGYQAVPSIHIIVKNGAIRLEGVVANQGDKNLAGLRANSVSAAFSVENDLQVESR
jgi:hyperosmotically inducible periplasmic protein